MYGRTGKIPLVKKIAAPADIMDLEEVEYKIRQYCQLWKLYAEISVELKRKSKLSWESVVTVWQGVWIVHLGHPATS